MADENKGGNKKKIAVKGNNKVKNFFLTIWIWFRETAWIQVLLVVVLVFGVVISIPLIVRAATAETPEDEASLSYFEGAGRGRRTVKEINDIVKNEKNYEYTTVCYYSSANSSSRSGYETFRDDILGGDYCFYNVASSFYTIDIERDEDHTDDNGNLDMKSNPDISTTQKQAIADIYAEFYDKNLTELNQLTDINTGKHTEDSSTSGKSLSDITDLPADGTIIAIYKNTNGGDFDLTTAKPVSLRYGFSSGDLTIRKEFFATISVNFNYNATTGNYDIVYLDYDVTNPDGDTTNSYIRYNPKKL